MQCTTITPQDYTNLRLLLSFLAVGISVLMLVGILKLREHPEELLVITAFYIATFSVSILMSSVYFSYSLYQFFLQCKTNIYRELTEAVKADIMDEDENGE